VSSGWTALEGPLQADPVARSPLRARERRALLLVLAALVAAGVLAAAAAGAVAPAMAVRFASLIGLGLLALLVASAALHPFERLQRRDRGSEGGGGAGSTSMLERTDRRLELAVSFAANYERLRRELRAVAEQRLGARGLRFESQAARDLLGAEAWQLLAEPARADGFAGGVEPAELERLLRALESV
jgi:hypothetical protein